MLLTLAIDFDRTLADTDHVPPGRKLGPPLPGAKDALVYFRERGDKIIVHTVRASDPRSIKVVKDWLDYFEIPYDHITNVKEPANFYIDDRGLRFHSWDQALKDIHAYEEPE